jgi:NAD(P)-dependent dehydrogenase (short-subunit alcohol dehydrogenase family)
MPATDSELRHMFDLTGHVGIVTGGSGGLGRMAAQGLAAFGADLVLVGRDTTKLDAARKVVEERRRKVICLTVDVSDPDAVEKMVRETLQTFHRIDFLVNAHGMNFRSPTDKMPIEEWDRVIDVNLRGVFLTCRAVGKAMIERGQGKIVNISSTAGTLGYVTGYSAYSPSKAGVDALTRTLAAEWGRHNINVNSVAPYFIETEMTRAVLGKKEFRDTVLAGLPLKRIGKPLDAAGAVVFLCSHASDWITGQTIYIDGGRTIA